MKKKNKLTSLKIPSSQILWSVGNIPISWIRSIYYLTFWVTVLSQIAGAGPTTGPIKTTTSLPDCGDGGFRCPDRCIDVISVCDGYEDCSDGSDEVSCPTGECWTCYSLFIRAVATALEKTLDGLFLFLSFILYQNPIHWAELTESSLYSLR